jgi:divalent metal cation (Fe/Co/Zn/Cd) transporter
VNRSSHPESNYRRQTPGWIGPVIALALSLLAFAAQWGVFNAKMDNLTERVSEWIVEQRENRSIQHDNARRISVLEGRITGLGAMPR